MALRATGSAALPVFKGSSAIRVGDSPQRLEEEVVALFDQFRDPLLRYLSSFGLALPDGEEVVQEIFLSLFQHLRGGKPRDNLRGWLFRVAHNLALKRRGRIRRDSELFTGTTNQDLAIDPAPNPEEQLFTNRTQRCLAAVVEALPGADRECLYLRAEGLRYREIAQVLDISLGSVALSLARSLSRVARAAER